MLDCFANNTTVSQKCYDLILQTMAESVIIIDTDCIVRFANTAAGKLAGIPASELVGKACKDIMDCESECNHTCAAFEPGELKSTECRVKRADGSLVPVMRNSRLIKDETGTPLAAVDTLTDISHLRRAEQRIAQLESEHVTSKGLHNIVGKSRKIQDIFELIRLAAASQATILVTGETGVGKEVVAKAIHALGTRKNGPFVAVNCSSLPENLLESELFGHARGSFTGAIKDKPGRFEMAEGGTLFLDEIGEISPLIQVKLLRFFQDKQFERIGESTTRKANVRIIAATNRNLRAMIRQGKFREDLFYRLKVFPIQIPPLRERKEDIGLLVDHFIARFNTETGKLLTGLTHDAAVMLMDYCWPGNIRELENAIEHAFVTCREGEIGLFDLPVEIRRYELRADLCGSTEDAAPNGSEWSSRKRINTITRDELLELMNNFDWNQSEVAKYLNVDRTTVWRNLKKLEIGKRKPGEPGGNAGLQNKA
ncbi:MAG: PAS domain S-box protein [Chitinivibrionales bacterium]|nr:PAS domain S-box protein [Chitinivibrionales bacterium]